MSLAESSQVSAFAQSGVGKTGAEKSSAEKAPQSSELTEFVADEGGQESVSGTGLLVSAYLVIWAVLFGFIFLTWKKQRALKVQLDRMEAALKADKPAG